MRPSRVCFRTVFCKCPRRAHSVPFYRERVKTMHSSSSVLLSVLHEVSLRGSSNQPPPNRPSVYNRYVTHLSTIANSCLSLREIPLMTWICKRAIQPTAQIRQIWAGFTISQPVQRALLVYRELSRAAQPLWIIISSEHVFEWQKNPTPELEFAFCPSVRLSRFSVIWLSSAAKAAPIR
jgi:hypothetical protein